MCTRCRGNREKIVMNSPLKESLMRFLGKGAKPALMRKRGENFNNLKHIHNA